ncbi:MAG: DUF4397 domain-containing protein [Chloroflexota bacterium]|nr:DUF4397 domain-containing protein [Chloroflexota bacterium]
MISWCSRHLIAALPLAAVLAAVNFFATLAQSNAEVDGTTVQVVHGAPAVGGIDLYVDDTLVFVGLTFTAVTDPITLGSGDRIVTIVPSGGEGADVLSRADVVLEPGDTVDFAILGPAEDLRIGAYPVDLSPLPPSLTRLDVVGGAADTGPLDIAVTGGDVLFPTLQYAGSTEPADVTTGTYDLEARYAGSEAIALALAGTDLQPELVHRLYIVGEAAIGQLQSIVVSRPANTVIIEGHPAWIQAGDCRIQTRAATADLAMVSTSPFAEPIGHQGAVATRSSLTTIGIGFDVLVGDAHAVVIGAADTLTENAVACGEVGGTPSDDGALVVGLRQVAASGAVGVAVLAPNVLDPTRTDVSVFLVEDDSAARLPAVSAADAINVEPDPRRLPATPTPDR